MSSLKLCAVIVVNSFQLSQRKKSYIFISPPRYWPKYFYTNKMGCQNWYKEAKIEKKLSDQSCRSLKSIGGIEKKNEKLPLVRVLEPLKGFLKKSHMQK